MGSSKEAITIANLTQAITLLLREEIGTVRVKGEISGFMTAASGHRYFILKDDSAQIDCVMWSSRSLSFRPKNGLQVVVQGRLTVYAPRGKYQIDCERMSAAGEGDLYLAFAALKEELAARGYFDPEHKRDIPSLPLKIGVVTSPTGAVIQDILSTLNRRSPHCQIYFCPATVQGEDAPNEIAKAIATLQATDADVLIVGRGGGSIEDLWAFNTLPVAEAIYHSPIPIISAVGHETDFTIADFVADLRAATPTAAAEIVSQCDRDTLMQQIDFWESRITRSVQQEMHNYHQRLNSLTNSYALQNFRDRLHDRAQQLDAAEQSMQKSLSRHLRQSTTKLDSITAHLRSLYPLSPLQRGFALLKLGDHLLTNDESLSELAGTFAKVEIVRSSEIAQASIEEVIKKVYDQTE
ncbi:MAG: exodeoxyribonuclease VII large subunit [Pseudanabaena sp.]|jgi:exodeoxyribonuclease VII large subunit|uniref:exodeoxyribonuclease VII large subunit n=1 Tax=Pseudanabaena mucicola TaxID=71190 RepID=UPI002575D421|nr:exodeoxyribonuclease VII large subunit [Pseudanabaena mucicola]MCA6571844.1 exodeoxyribonuclease VII large subunit [Pseudanabaena sp. M53BS1SP1A06MG]MCA6581036.1 exodeoxyribonuclease VII large subunit [Pseudanabaena sp. M34BS1SP1A06MG]MCA6584923.1 exodeoxyribonuclease VII large subunit [Pseudanabaena sp. M051S1SP1A06QC]MCA6588251.1 exodeoxyribonuclease VII large subunit [Pseudanabaena sp. M109S1SP1A06QC]MCA6593968.1 exodeoxyribonuclease VII large subunit [Pseudanabaena sp. M38BS1SP1A06MG]M